MPKLALIGPVPPWRGGIAHHTAELLKGLKASHQVLTISFATMYPGWLYPGQTPSVTPAQEDLSSAPRFLLSGVDPRTWRKAVDEIAEFQPDAVVIPWWTVFWAPFCLYTNRAFAQRDIPTLFLCHNISDHNSRWWKRKLARLALRHGDGFLTHTEQDRRLLTNLLPSARVTVYPHPPYECFPDPAQVPRRRAALELLFFGYVRDYKGVDLLIDALGSLPNLDFHLCIAGEFWIDQSDLERQIERLGIRDRVTLIPHYVDDQETAELVSAADAVVLPYREATGSGVAALALHYNTPVVATRVGGLAESVVEGETGYLVEPGSPEQIAAGIARLLQPKDWAKSILPHKQTASWEGMAAAIDEVIATVRTHRDATGSGTDSACHGHGPR